MISEKNRQFEIPYNFDPSLINTIRILDGQQKSFVNCIYIPPYLHDYQTILRTPESAEMLNKMTRKEYERHINFINTIYPGKIQILLQNPNIIMDNETLKYYNNLGINKFCSSSAKQSEIIRKSLNESNIVGSISMKVSKEHLDQHPEYKELFDGFVLHFPFSKSLSGIKDLPNDYYYLLLVNAYCNTKCPGTHHWFSDYKTDFDTSKFDNCIRNTTWQTSALVNPADLNLFDPYIKIFKLQDRGWPTADIIRDFVLYTSDYNIYPNIDSNPQYYNEPLYSNHLLK